MRININVDISISHEVPVKHVVEKDVVEKEFLITCGVLEERTDGNRTGHCIKEIMENKILKEKAQSDISSPLFFERPLSPFLL